MGVVNKPASWMVNLEFGVEKGPGDWPFFMLQLSHKFYNNKSYVFLSLE